MTDAEWYLVIGVLLAIFGFFGLYKYKLTPKLPSILGVLFVAIGLIMIYAALA